MIHYSLISDTRLPTEEKMSATEDASVCAAEGKVKMIYDGEKGDIISQYVTFTRIYNEQMKKYGRTRRAVLETIQICRDENI